MLHLIYGNDNEAMTQESRKHGRTAFITFPGGSSWSSDKFLELADELLKDVDQVDRVVVTHSEEIALRVKRRVDQDQLNLSHVMFYYVTKDRTTEIPLCREGHLGEVNFATPWPNGFFDWRFKELFY